MVYILSFFSWLIGHLWALNCNFNHKYIQNFLIVLIFDYTYQTQNICKFEIWNTLDNSILWEIKISSTLFFYGGRIFLRPWKYSREVEMM